MKERSTIELMVLAFTATVCVSILLIGATVAALAVFAPETDTSGIVNVLTNVLSVILGALLGLLAGRTDRLTAMVTRKGADGGGL